MPRADHLVIAGVAVFVALVAVQHPLRADLPPAEHFVSEYARGSTAPLQVAAFLAWGAAGVGCVACALRRHERPVARAITAGALAIAVAGTLLAAAFATETVAGERPPGLERTLGGRLHDVGTLLILAGLTAAALASLRLVPRTGYRLLVAALAAALLAIVPVLVALGVDAPGIGQRGFILVGCAWQLAFARATFAPVTARARVGAVR